MNDKNKSEQHTTDQHAAVPLAIVGIACRFPRANDAGSFWANIRDGVDAISDIPATHWNPDDYFNADQSAPDMTYARRGGFIDAVDFDPLLYGLSPNNIEATDSTQLLGMVIARQALLDAGYATGKDSDDGRPFDRDRTSVILGVTGTLELVIPLGARLGHPIWRQALADAGVDKDTAEDVVQRIADGYVPWQENSFPGLLGNVAAGRIANRFDLGGTNCVVDAACASSLSAIHMAAMELSAGRADMAITGGFDTFNDIFMYMCFSKTPALSASGDCRPFDRNADGTLLGEGLGAIVLKRLDDAKRDGDRIYAVLKGIGSSSDGRGNAIYAPSIHGQMKAIRNAYKHANVSPASIELVETHGTGTKVGDAVEAEALATIYREDQQAGSWCAIGSVKSMIGHTKAAAGIAGMIKIAMALRQKVLPPTIKIEQPLDLLQPGAAPLYVNTGKRPWLASKTHPRRAALSAFGFGGSNFHCVLEEAETEKPEIDWDGKVLLFLYSDDSIDALHGRLQQLDYRQDWSGLRAEAARSRQSFDVGQPYRLSLVATAETQLAKLFTGAGSMLKQQTGKTCWSTPDGAYFGSGKDGVQQGGKLGLLFPGQGSQYTNMLLDLACQFPQMQSALAQAEAEFSNTQASQGLHDFVYPKAAFSDEARQQNEHALRATQHAQPAIGAVSLGALNILRYFGIRADASAGHSFGELTALCAAGVIKDEDLHKLAIKRGELMQAKAGDHGAMLAVSASAAVVHEFLETEPLDLIIANNNAPAQVVLSGATDQIDRAMARLQQRGVVAKKLPVSAAFHSIYVADAEKPFTDFLQAISFEQGDISVYANSTAEPYPADGEKCKTLLAGQLAKPVEFVRQIENMYAAGITTFVEVGPGKTLSTLVNAILGEKQHQALALDASRGKRSGQYDLASLLAQLSVSGQSLALEKWDEAWLDSYSEASSKAKSLMSISVGGANYVKPRLRREAVKIKTTMKSENSIPGPVANSTGELNRAVPPGSQTSEALQITQQNILTLQKMQEQTAQLHKQYLQGQQLAQQNIQQLIHQQRTVLTGDLAAPVIAPDLPPVVEVAAAAPGSQASKPAEVKPAPVENNISAPHDSTDYETLLLEVVAEKTGYPVDMLSMGMSLDTDLGIDSIKRVEILSALQEKLPGVSKIKPEDLGTFHILKHIVEFLAADAPVETVAATTAVSEGETRLAAVLLEVVADKTGYPVEMLSLGMNMDTDLGIDSIKRVEILSAFQEKMPEAPTVNPENLASLQTLQQIVDFMLSGVDHAAEVHHDEATATIEEDNAVYRSIVEVEALGEANRGVIKLAENSLILVSDDGSDFPGKICTALEKLNLRAELISLDAQIDNSASGLIILAPANADSDFIIAAFQLLQRAADTLKQAGKNDAAILTGISRLGGAFGIEDLSSASPVSGGLAGLVKTAAKEWPDVHCKAIDIPDKRSSAKLASTIVEEVLRQGPLETGIRDSGLCRLALKAAVVSEPGKIANPFAPGDVVVITGGARGVTAEIAVAMANKFHTDLLLLGRSPLPVPEAEWLAGLQEAAAIKKAIIEHSGANNPTPATVEREYRQILANREIMRNIKRMQDSGVNVAYQSVDVRDKPAVAAVINTARKARGNIAGIIHGAGVLADRVIEDKTLEQFQQVYSTKVDGLQSLLAACEQDKLKVMLMFSSSTARLGRKGQVDYAAANEVLNKIAQHQKNNRADCRVLSVNWGPWDGGMVTPQLKKLFASEGIGVIALQAGADYLMQEISTAGPVEVVVLGSDIEAGGNADKQNSMPGDSLHLVSEHKLNIAGYPVLLDHVINGKAVLPTALIAEWLAHGALHNHPGLSFMGFNDFCILKGVTIDAEETVSLQIMAARSILKGNEDHVVVELCSGKVKHARAEVVLGTDYAQPVQVNTESINGDYPFNDREFYTNGQLFHGPALQSLQSITACSASGIAGKSLSAPLPSAWMVQPMRSSWIADPMILDAAFQLMILWSFQQSGRPSLPTRFASYRQYQRRFPKQGVNLNVYIEKAGEHAATASIEFFDDQKKPLARIEGYECVIDASLNAAFKRNTMELPA